MSKPYSIDLRELAALAYWQDFDRRIPRNSQRDSEWLNRELKSGDAERVNRALGAPQYALDRLALLSSACVGKFTTLSDSVGANRLVETYWWREVAGCYTNARETIDYLEQAGLSDGKSDEQFAFHHAPIMSEALRGKIEQSVAKST